MPTTTRTAPTNKTPAAAGTATPAKTAAAKRKTTGAKKPRAKKAPSAASQYTATLSPVEGILAVLNDGHFFGTNKYGLLLALIDLALHVNPDTGTLDINEIAETLLTIHWAHADPYHFLNANVQCRTQILRQVGSGNGQLVVVQQVRELTDATRDRTAKKDRKAPVTYERARQLLHGGSPDPDPAWTAAVRAVAANTAKYPLRLLQVLPGRPEDHPDKFLYTIQDGAPVTIEFVPGVLHDLITYGPVLRDLVQARFAATVTRMNKFLAADQETRVADHLFGADRHMPPQPLRKELLGLQGDKRLYTGKKVTASSVDHMVPWARARISVVENFVVTSRSDNSKKQAALLAPDLLRIWVDHIGSHHNQIVQAASKANWPCDLGHVVATADVLYRQPATSVRDLNKASGATFIRPMTPDDRDDALRHLTGLSA